MDHLMSGVLAEREYPTVKTARPSLERLERTLHDGSPAGVHHNMTRRMDDLSPVHLAPQEKPAIAVTTTIRLDTKKIADAIVRYLSAC